MKARGSGCRWTARAAVLAACLGTANDRARAAERAIVCEDARVSIVGDPAAAWVEPIARACDALRAMRDGDPTARIQITAQDSELSIEVRLNDGRTAVRQVSDPATLTTTLEALVALPPAPEPAPAPAASASPTAPSHSAPPVEPGDGGGPRDRGQPEEPPAAGPGIEIGGLLSGRVAGSEGYLSPSVGTFAQLRARSWRFGMSARWDVIQVARDVTTPGFEMETVAIGLSLARRWRTGFGALELGMSPRLVAETQSYNVGDREITGSHADIRLAAFARSVFGQSAWRFLVELDGELSPARARRSIQIDPILPPLPAWSVGIGGGFMWGEP